MEAFTRTEHPMLEGYTTLGYVAGVTDVPEGIFLFWVVKILTTPGRSNVGLPEDLWQTSKAVVSRRRCSSSGWSH